MHSPRRILLVKPSSMGDVIHALPVVAAMHQAWPKAEIRWLIHPAWSPLVEEHPAVSKVILFPRDRFRGVLGWGRSLWWARTLRGWHPDLAIDLQGLLRSALMARLSRAKYVIGLSDAREGASLFYSRTVAVNKKNHAVTRYLQMLQGLGLPIPSPEFHLPEGSLPNGFLESVSKPFVVLHPYARGEGKDLSEAQVNAFASALQKIPVVLVGQGKQMKHLLSNVVDWSGRTTLLELIAILRQASFIVSSDSGPMHLAAALQPAKTLAIHRWSDPIRVGPWAGESLVWKSGSIVRQDQLSEACRAPGPAPTLEEMGAIGEHVLKSMNRAEE